MLSKKYYNRLRTTHNRGVYFLKNIIGRRINQENVCNMQDNMAFSFSTSTYGWSLPNGLSQVLEQNNEILQQLVNKQPAQLFSSQLICLNTNNRTSGSHNNATFTIPSITLSTNQYVTIQLENFSTLFNWLQLQSNAVFAFQTGSSSLSFTIPAGSYAYLDLAIFITQQMRSLTNDISYICTYNSDTNLFTVSGSSLTSITISNTDLQRILGFSSTNTASNNTFTGLQANLYSSLVIRSLISNITPFSGSYNTLSTISFSSTPFTILNYRDMNNSSLRIADTTLSTLTMELTDQAGNLISCGAVDYTIRINVYNY
jgi:hypothetical protein